MQIEVTTDNGTTDSTLEVPEFITPCSTCVIKFGNGLTWYSLCSVKIVNKYMENRYYFNGL